MGLGAIVVVGAERDAVSVEGSRSESLLTEPLACVDVAGRSLAERSIERFLRAEVEVVSVLVQGELPRGMRPLAGESYNVEVEVVNDAWAAVARKLADYALGGIEHSFVLSASAYAETDLLDLYSFHREGRQAATRAIDREGPLDLWVVDCEKAEHSNLETLLGQAEALGASYFVREYAARLAHPRDLRKVASDVLRGRCAMRPWGREIKAGIWIAEEAEIHKRARIVAPAYIGYGSKLREDTLITRLSSVERGCYVDYGTVVEDSSILPNTHVGIWLDVCHAVANGNKLLSLGRDVILDIADPGVLRFRNAVAATPGNLGNRAAAQPAPYDLPETVAGLGQVQEPAAAEAWQLGTNLIQG